MEGASLPITSLAGRHASVLVAKASSDGADESTGLGFFSDIEINPPYALAWALFLGYGYVAATNEPAGASAEYIEQFIADPLSPGWNEAFLTVWNLLGLYWVPMACLLLPAANRQKLPAMPFVLGSMFGGYGALGPYAFTRKPNPSALSKSDLGFFTANILENKLFNFTVALLFLSAYVTSGFVGALVEDPGQLVRGYAEMFPGAAVVSASTVDFAILTIAAGKCVC